MYMYLAIRRIITKFGINLCEKTQLFYSKRHREVRTPYFTINDVINHSLFDLSMPPVFNQELFIKDVRLLS